MSLCLTMDGLKEVEANAYYFRQGFRLVLSRSVLRRQLKHFVLFGGAPSLCA